MAQKDRFIAKTPSTAKPQTFLLIGAGMANLQLTEVPVVKTGMLIRKPVTDVFEAFIDPEITTKFWFTKSSGRLETGKQIRWEWEMYNSGTDVNVKAIEPN